MKLLIAGPDEFADVACSTLLVRCLKQQLPESFIQYQVKAQWADVLSANAYIDALETEISKEQELNDLDGIIDLTSSAQWRRTAAQKDCAYLTPKSSLLQKIGIQLMPQKHRAVQYLAAAKSLMITDDGRGLDYFIPSASHVAAHDIPVAHSAGYIALVLRKKELPASALHLLQAFCNALQHPLILIGDKDAAGIAARLSAADEIKIYAACGKFSRNENADLIRRSKLVITTETGWLQVAAAFKKPVIALRNAGKSSAYYPPLYDASFLRQRLQAPYRQLLWPAAAHKVSVAAQQKKEVWMEQLLQLVQEQLSPVM